MKKSAFLRVLLGSLFFSLFLGAMLPQPVFADDGNPPTDPVPTETSGSGENDPVVVPPTDESLEPEDSLAGGDELVADGMSGSAVSDDDAALEAQSTGEPQELGNVGVEVEGEVATDDTNWEAMESVIADEELSSDEVDSSLVNEIAIASESGDLLPLASESAAEILATGDPIWCPASVSVPKPNTGGCTDSFDSLDALFDELEIHPKTVDGIIWIEKDYSDTTAATLDGSLASLITMRNFKITLKGGWNGCGINPPTSCVGSIDIANPSEINHPVEVLNWNNDITLSDVLVTGDTGSSDALLITTTGKITLTRVEVSINEGSGARLDNLAGSKDVSITASSFNGNAGGAGLNVVSNGAVMLSDVTAANNGGSGAYVNNVSPTLKNITLLGTNVFSENLGHGLEIYSGGQIAASNLVNDANGNYGLWIDNSSSTKNVTISGASEFKFNGGGLKIISDGAITLNNITASYSSLFEGASLDNSGGLAVNVTLTGANVFNFNQLNGLSIQSHGSITLNATTASGNGQSGTSGYGAWLDNMSAGSAKAIIINTGTFSDNFEGGLFAASNGAITISRLTASGNEGKGAELNNLGANPAAPQNVALTNFVNTNLNQDVGLDIQTLGAITIASLSSSDNSGEGAILTNDQSSAPKSVTLTGTVLVSENAGAGLVISSKGAIILNNVTANINIGPGAEINNDINGAIGNVILTGTNIFSDNTGDGLAISSRGNITIGNITASRNSGNGISLDNAQVGFQGSVGLGTSLANWCNELSENSESGLKISSNGTVTVVNVCAIGNGSFTDPGYGAEINNQTSITPRPVVLSGLNSFTENYTGGLQILSNGSITVANLTASNNLHGFGAILDNASNVNKPQSIVLTGSNQVSANYAEGLTITSFGAITVNNLSASSNGANGGSGYGAWIDNCNLDLADCTTAAAQPITFGGRNTFSSNNGDGLFVISLGLIKAANLSASSNSGNGATLNNDFAGAIGGITLTGSASFLSNDANGLDVTTRRAISISNLEASSNLGYGANLSNYLNPPSPQNISLIGFAIFDDNGGYGLLARGLGAITIGNLSASLNDAQGAILDNAEPAATGAVTLIGVQSFLYNGGSGLQITSNRAVTIGNLSASLNNDYGATIDNKASGQSFNISLTGVNNFIENDLTGLDIRSYGAITLNSIAAIGNGVDALVDYGYGVYLDNWSGAPAAKPITLTGTNTFNENFEDGLRALSLGQINVNSLTALMNGGSGVYLDNETGANSAGIAVTGVNTFQLNGGFGLAAISRGTISLANATAILNLEGGAVIDNSNSDMARNVSITGTNIFNDNGNTLVLDSGPGLSVDSRGIITLSNVTADGNSSYGVYLNNFDYAIGSPAVTLMGTNSFSGNGNTGLYVLAAGEVKLTKIVADNNVGDGLSIVTLKNVSLTCASLISNQGTGLYIFATNGKITLSGVFAYGNTVEMNLAALDTIMVRACPPT